MRPYFDDGQITIYCADSIKIIPNLNEKIDLTITSPPYNLRTRIRNGEYTKRETAEHFCKKYRYFDDDLTIDEYFNFHKSVISLILSKSDYLFWNIQIVTGSKEAVFKLIGEFAKYIKDVIVWDKGSGQPAMHSNVLNKATELIYIFEKNPKAGRALKKCNFERGKLDDIWRIKRGGNKYSKKHSAVFPPELPLKIIKNFSNEGDTILDPFNGSGTTTKMAQQLNRRAIGIELSEEYCQIAVERLSHKTTYHLPEQVRRAKPIQLSIL